MSRTDKPKTFSSLHGYAKRETDKAILFEVCDHPDLSGRSIWFPLSQIRAIHRREHPDLDSIEVADWLVEAKISE